MGVANIRNGLDPCGGIEPGGRANVLGERERSAPDTGHIWRQHPIRHHRGSATNVAIADNPLTGLIGSNLFANPTAVHQAYPPTLLNQVTSGNFSGNLRGMARWNLDMDIARNLQWTERVSATLWLQMFNVFNHAGLVDATLSRRPLHTVVVLGTQLNRPRILNLGLGIDF